MRTTIVILFLLLSCSCSISFAQDADVQKGNWLLGVIFKLERMKDKATEDVQQAEVDIQKCDAAISKSQDLIRLAQERGNTQAEMTARQLLTTAQEARTKNTDQKKLAERNKQRAEGALAYMKTGGKDPECKVEQVEFENAPADWTKKHKDLVEQRTSEPNPSASAIYKSLKIKAPPPLPPRKYEELKSGDVMLISPDDKISFWINLGDRLSSLSLSPASHTVLYLKEVNGKKLFLDNTEQKGSHVISEAEFLSTYGQREILVAQPVKPADTAAIWAAAKDLVKKEQKIQTGKSGNIIDKSGFGLYGNDNMVCSEASRWVLVQSGLKIPETASPLKRLLGIHYGPANFFADDHNFIITPLWGSPNDPVKKSESASP